MRRIFNLRFWLHLFGVAAALLSLSACSTRPDRATRELQLSSELRAIAPDVEAHDLEWTDESRNRSVPVRIYVSGNGSTKRLPIVVFSHGLGGSRFGYSHLGRYWASQGLISVHLQHPGSDRSVWGARGLALLGSLQDAASTDEAIARAKDVRFVLDRLLEEPRWRALADGQRIAVAGHSFGANTALLVAGARFRENGQVRQYADARVRAAIVMSPPSLPREHDPTFVYTGIVIPTLHLTGTADYTPIPGFVTQTEDRRVPFDSIAVSPRYLAIFEQGRHSMFNDWTRDEVSAAIKASTRQLTLSFLRSTLEGDSQASRTLGELRADHGSLAVWEAR